MRPTPPWEFSKIGLRSLRGERCVKRVGQRLLHRREQMPVAIERDRYRGVTEPRRDQLWVSSGGDRQRSAGVPEVVETQASQPLRQRTGNALTVALVPRDCASEVAAVDEAVPEPPATL